MRLFWAFVILIEGKDENEMLTNLVKTGFGMIFLGRPKWEMSLILWDGGSI